MSVVIETTEGDITVDLFLSERPKTCYNFLKLCKIKYYNFLLFHKVQKDFIAQTGDPTGTGKGGDSVYYHLYGEKGRFFEREFKPKLKHEQLGTLSMVNNGENLHGSQFFLTLGENLDYLDADHNVFGQVTEGLEVLIKLNEAICDEEHRPFRDIRITHTVILDDPFDDPPNLPVPDRSPEPGPEIFESNRIGIEEAVDDNDGKTMEEIEEEMKDKEAKARATILEMIGDLPDADIAPPENALFVCKLNPVTRDEDLEIIFSRFGPIVSCEVIRDAKSGESLQYAFIEFKNEADCEKAYFKMDNVLIDDRRIHVDFSQSVSKIKWRGKGRGVEHFPDADESSSRSKNRSDFGFKKEYHGRDRNDKKNRNNNSSKLDNRSRFSDRRKDERNSGSNGRRDHRSRSRDNESENRRHERPAARSDSEKNVSGSRRGHDRNHRSKSRDRHNSDDGNRRRDRRRETRSRSKDRKRSRQSSPLPTSRDHHQRHERGGRDHSSHHSSKSASRRDR